MKYTIQMMLNEYCMEHLNIQHGDLDIRFKFMGRKYRIHQFCPLWMVLECAIITGIGIGSYMIIVGMITACHMIGG